MVPSPDANIHYSDTRQSGPFFFIKQVGPVEDKVCPKMGMLFQELHCKSAELSAGKFRQDWFSRVRLSLCFL